MSHCCLLFWCINDDIGCMNSILRIEVWTDCRFPLTDSALRCGVNLSRLLHEIWDPPFRLRSGLDRFQNQIVVRGLGFWLTHWKSTFNRCLVFDLSVP